MKPRLLREAAKALDAGMDPFETAFLARHDVTYDECMEMGEALAMGARLVAWALEHPEEAAGAVNGAAVVGAYRALNAKLRQANAGGVS